MIMERYNVSEGSDIVDVVLWYFPEMDNEDVEWVMYNRTSFPFGEMVDWEKGVYLYWLEMRLFN